MKGIWLFLGAIACCFAAVDTNAQGGEGLQPLQHNGVQARKAATTGLLEQRLASCSGYYVFSFDTLAIGPGSKFVDDFSTDRFQNRNPDVTGTNVLDTTLYKLWSGGVPLVDTARFRIDTTFRFTVTISPTDTVVVETPLPSQIIDVLDYCQWPPVLTQDEVWPRYTIRDSFPAGTSDTINITPNLRQDSAVVYLVDSDPNVRWVDEFVYRNGTYPVDPPTVGVVTFDGLDETGQAYDFSINSQGLADVLTSVPMNLAPYVPADSVYLSFWLQAEGLGNAPEASDSLVVEMLNGITGNWDWAWSAPGEGVQSFREIIIPIENPDFMYNGFQFRFRNYASLNGNLDHWNVDYVMVDRFRQASDLLQDVAYRYPMETILKEFTTMPWTHFKAQPEIYMADSVALSLGNFTAINETVEHRFQVDHEGTLQENFISNTTTPVAPYAVVDDYQFVRAFQNVVLDTSVNDTCATFSVRLVLDESDQLRSNDTIQNEQTFWNQYAYDDGTAEAAYGLLGTASKLAYRFNVPFADTLDAVYMSFSPVVDDWSNEPFRLTVWAADGSGGEPGTILAENITVDYPEYFHGYNGFQRVELEAPIIVSGGFYVGWTQLTDERINIGFDRNRNFSNRIYYNTDNLTWNSTSFDGALLMRPSFKTSKDFLLTIPQNKAPLLQELTFDLYPNPATEAFTVRLPDHQPYTLRVLDIGGRTVAEQGNVQWSVQMDASNYEPGIYLVQIMNELGQVATQRLIVQ